MRHAFHLILTELVLGLAGCAADPRRYLDHDPCSAAQRHHLR
jgi:hypothetical protein